MWFMKKGKINAHVYLGVRHWTTRRGWNGQAAFAGEKKLGEWHWSAGGVLCVE